MRIGIYTSIIASEPGYEQNVSAHVQIPLHAAHLLANASHEVHLISTRQPEDKTLPACLPTNATLDLVTDARVRPERLRGGTPRHGIRPLAMWSQLRQIRHLARKHRLDVLHLFGFARTAQLGGLLRQVGLGIPTVCTLLGEDIAQVRSGLARRFVGRNAALVTATEAVAAAALTNGWSVDIVRHGVVRPPDASPPNGAPSSPRPTVLFWRDATEANGADLCMEAFQRVAPRHRDLEFAFAVRPHVRDVPGLDDLAANHENVTVHRFPYADGITLESLTQSACLIVLPFRELSVQPQFAVLESLATGVPVVASDLGSNRELIEDGVNGALVPSDDAGALTSRLSALLDQPESLGAMGEAARLRVASEWNWDSYVDEMMAIYKRVCPAPATSTP